MVNADGGSQFSVFFQSIGLDWRLAATRRSVYIHQMNWMNSRYDFGLDDSIINIILLIIIIPYCYCNAAQTNV